MEPAPSAAQSPLPSDAGKLPLPGLFPGLRERLIYWLFEPVWWSIWYRHERRVIGCLPDSPCVVVANHSSYLDWLLLHVVLRRKFHRKIQFLAKEKVLRNPLFRELVHATESVVVEETKKTRALALAARIFSANPGGKPVVGIFPEGTRSRDGEPLPAIGGGAWLARKCGVSLVPVALCGFWSAWPPHRRLPTLRRGRLAIHFLPPIRASDFPDDQAAVDFAMGQVHALVRRERAAATRANGQS